MSTPRGRGVVLALALGISLAGCTVQGSASRAEAPASTESNNQGGTTAPATPGSSDRTFRINGHDVYVHCAGTGPQTVVFLHGSDATLEPTQYVQPVEQLLTDDFRFCVYDRANIGLSAHVDEVPAPEQLTADVDGVLDAIGTDQPVLLLGASFGGLLADMYAREHPERVAGIVELDSIFPGMLPLDRLVPAKDTAKAHSADDKANSLERISTYDFLRYGEARAAHQLRIPLVYLATGESWKDTPLGKKYDHAAQAALAAYVGAFSPGVVHWVDAPHFMEPVIPDRIAAAVREAAAASNGPHS